MVTTMRERGAGALARNNRRHVTVSLYWGRYPVRGGQRSDTERAVWGHWLPIARDPPTRWVG